jgi:hypothetical protein
MHYASNINYVVQPSLEAFHIQMFNLVHNHILQLQMDTAVVTILIDYTVSYMEGKGLP